MVASCRDVLAVTLISSRARAASSSTSAALLRVALSYILLERHVSTVLFFLLVCAETVSSGEHLRPADRPTALRCCVPTPSLCRIPLIGCSATQT